MSGDPVGPEIAEDAPDALADKAHRPWPRMAAQAVLAGAFIAVGSIAFLVVQAGAAEPGGPVRLLSGLAFSVGLLLVMVVGAELFTGNTMFALPAARGQLSPVRLAGAWTVAWLGNLAGSLAVSLLFAAAGGTSGPLGDGAIRVALDKLDKTPVELLASGVLANMLVCLAVWGAMSARTVPAKAAAIAGPVAIFVAAGLEHSIANMSLLPIGLLSGGEGTAGAIAANLVLSTIGNIGGGALLALLIGYAVGGEEED